MRVNMSATGSVKFILASPQSPVCFASSCGEAKNLRRRVPLIVDLSP
jgi:hypothetical protein